MDFPLSVAMLMDVLEVTAPFKHFAKLRDFVNLKLPPGFPVKLGMLYQWVLNLLSNKTCKTKCFLNPYTVQKLNFNLSI